MSGFLVMETTQTPEGRRVTGNLHKPAPTQLQAFGRYRRPVTIREGVQRGAFSWPTRCGRDGIVYLDAPLFRREARCEECAA